jgi:hypothetical protein
MYTIGRRRGSSFERLPDSPEFPDDQEYEARQWATLYMAENKIPFAGHPDSLEVYHEMVMPKGGH